MCIRDRYLPYHVCLYRELSAPRLVRCYGNLYSQGRVNALEALDSMPQLHGAAELKSKILFSIVVVKIIEKFQFVYINQVLTLTFSLFILALLQLAFRSTQALLAQKKDQIKQLLFTPSSSNTSQAELEAAITTYFRRTIDTFDITACIEVRFFPFGMR